MLPIPVPRWYPKAYKRYGGSSWFILNRQFCEYLGFDRGHEKLLAFLKHTYIPEEEYFHTVIMHSPFKETVVNDSKRYVNFVAKWAVPRLARMLRLKGHYLGFNITPKGVYYSRLKTLTMQDLGKLNRSDAFFARKFDETVDREIIDVLESRLTATTPRGNNSAHATAG